MRRAPTRMLVRKIEAMVADGKSAKQISDALQVKLESVTNWVNHFKKADKAEK